MYQYNPYPNINGLSGAPYAFFGMGETPSPFFTLAGQFTPRNFNDVVKWTRFLIVNSPTITEVTRKMASYPITNFVLPTEDASVKKKYTDLFKAIDFKTKLINIGFDYQILGNSFVSIYYPIKRILYCQTRGCGAAYTVENFPGKLSFTQFQFRGRCPKCGNTGILKRRDEKSMDVREASIINWDPTDISINYNPIVDKSEYWYKIPAYLKNKIVTGDLFVLSTVPWEFVEAVQKNLDFKFNKDGIFHLKGMTVAHSIPGYGVPPLVGLYNLVFDQAMLRRANSAIAAEMISPLRVIFPEVNGKTDAAVNMSLKGFAKNMRKYFALHKSDPNLIAFSPVPIGYQALSGEGKTLLVTQEIEQIDDTILLSLGVSRELLSGQLNWTSSDVGLRLLENTMWKYTDQIQKLITWIVSGLTAYFNIPTLDVTLEPFKLADNNDLKNAMMALAQSNQVSMQTLLSSMGLDFQKEQEKINKEQIMLAKDQAILTVDKEIAAWMALKNGPNADSNTVSGYKSALQKAQETANELIGMPEGPRRSALMRLKTEDPAQYLMVAKLIDEYRNDPQYQQEVASQGQEAAEQASSQGQPGDNSQPNQPAQ